MRWLTIQDRTISDGKAKNVFRRRYTMRKRRTADDNPTKRNLPIITTDEDFPHISLLDRPATIPEKRDFPIATALDGSFSDHQTLFTNHRVTRLKVIQVDAKKIVPFKTDFLLNEGLLIVFLFYTQI